MQFDDTASKTNLSQKQKEQLRGYSQSKLKNAEKKEETNILDDQNNIRQIIKKHPYKKWETILDGPGTE